MFTKVLLAAVGAYFIRGFITPPPSLAHIPQVPLLSLLASYLSGETEGERTRRVLLPYAAKVHADVLLVWLFGTWMVYVVDHKTAKIALEDKTLLKQAPAKEMLFWHLTGFDNIVLSEGQIWKSQSDLLRNAIRQAHLLSTFSVLSQKLMERIGKGGTVVWNEYTRRFTLDAVGLTIFGHDFRSLDLAVRGGGGGNGEKSGEKDVSVQYSNMMNGIANPVYLALPILEKLWPRRQLVGEIEAFRETVMTIVKEKRKVPGDDVVSRLLEVPSLSNEMVLNTSISILMAGHDTSAAGLSSVIYYLAIFPSYQSKARQDVLQHYTEEPLTPDTLNKMTILDACIREALRANSPATILIPRMSSTEAVTLGGYKIPANTLITVNVFGALHNLEEWEEPAEFRPERYLVPSSEGDGKGIAASVPASWIPFGLGRRQCPAKNFTLLELRVLVAHLLKKYKWELPPDSIHLKKGVQNAWSPFAFNYPKDLDVTFEALE